MTSPHTLSGGELCPLGFGQAVERDQSFEQRRQRLERQHRRGLGRVGVVGVLMRLYEDGSNARRHRGPCEDWRELALPT